MSELQDRLRRMRKAPVFLKDAYEQVAFRSHPRERGYFLKRKGDLEYMVQTDSKLATDIILGGDEITKKQYENY